MKAHQEVWYVMGETDNTDMMLPTLFDSKEAAEVYARMMFPNEDADKRYGRILFRNILTMFDLHGG